MLNTLRAVLGVLLVAVLLVVLVIYVFIWNDTPNIARLLGLHA